MEQAQQITAVTRQSTEKKTRCKKMSKKIHNWFTENKYVDNERNIVCTAIPYACIFRKIFEFSYVCSFLDECFSGIEQGMQAVFLLLVPELIGVTVNMK